jgi:hypothetical protein
MLAGVLWVAAPSGKLETASSMARPRAAHTATTLADGRVLVVGGFTDQTAPAHAELFAPATGRFTPVPRMVQARHSHTATRLADGQVLIAGGYGAQNAPIASAEVFDPRTGLFVATGSLRQPRAGHVAVLLRDGRVVLIGGVGPEWRFLASAEVFDPATGRFETVGAMREAREGHAAVRLQDGSVLVVGGHRGRRADMVLHASAERFDPATQQFADAGLMALPRHKHDAVLLPDGRALVLAGADQRDSDGQYASTEIYAPATRAFSPGPALMRPRYKLAGTTVVLGTGEVLVAGGAESAEILDVTRGLSRLVPGATRLSGQFSAVAPLPDGGALVTGGYGGGTGPRADTWRYRP